MPTREEILKQALELSPEEREILRIQLDESLLTPKELPNGGFETPELAKTWSAELDRRIEALHRGEIETIDIETSLQHIRDALEANRKRNNVA